MKKTWKKTLAALLSLSMVAGTVVLPAVTASAANVGTTWKFDFGTAENLEDGWIAVAKDDSYAGNAGASPVQYGFLGTDGHGDSYGQYVDGVVTKQGQNVTLKAGAKESVATASDDYLGVDQEETLKACKIDGAYPIRFAMKAESDSYYNVKVKLTTFDQTAAAVATVFSERHHAIILEEPIAAGAEKEVEFNTTIQPFYLKDSGTYNDDMLNVVVVGENIAVESIVIEKTEPKTTIWMYDDSTGCDYQMDQPYFALQNYGGTGSFLSKYLPKDIVAVNQGEGGLSAIDNLHWNCAKDHIGADDYVYVQYGHNHKNDANYGAGTYGYLSSIPKYYEHAHSVGAKTIYAGPIDRHNWALDKGNEQQYHVEAVNGYHWTSTLAGYSKAAKYYTEILLTAGKAKADEFVTKAETDALETEGAWVSKDPDKDGVFTDTAITVVQKTYDWADDVIAAGLEEGCVNGVDDVAFVDLNQPTIDWLEGITTTIQALRSANGQTFTGVNVGSASDYYFRCQKGTGVDGTHANDAGADNTASFFFDEANKTIALASSDSATAAEKTIAAKEAAILTPLVTNMRTTTDNAYVVSDDIILAGTAPNSAWPLVYAPSNLAALPLVIKDIAFADNGTLTSATLYRQAAEKSIATYGLLDIEVKKENGTTKGHFYSKQIEPDGINGSTFVINGSDFTSDPAGLILEEGDTYTAVVRAAIDDPEQGVIIDTEKPDEYSAVYEPTDIETDLLVDDFDYYGVADGTTLATNLIDSTKTTVSGLPDGQKWSYVASAGGFPNVVTKKNGDCYTEITSNGSGSFNLWRNFDVTDPGMTNTGRYMFAGDFNYTSGGGAVVRLANGASNNNRQGSENIVLFKIAANGVITIGDTATEAGALSQAEWKTVKAIVDTDLGTLSVSVAGDPAVTVNLANYQTTSTTVNPAKLTQIHFGGDSNAYSYLITNLHVAKLKDQTLPTKKMIVDANDKARGKVSIAGRESGLTYGYDSGTVTVNTDKAMKVAVIDAAYTGDALSSVTISNLDFAEAGSKTATVTPGDTIMLWTETVEDMKPLVEPFTAEGTIAADISVTKPLNTVVTAVAEASEGSVFMGWSDGTDIVSTDAEYTFRLRDDITLTAQFFKEPTVDDVTDFVIKGSSAGMKSTVGSSVTMTVSDAVDTNGRPYANIKNTDITWNCAETGVDVSAAGVVTIGSGFSMGDADTKTITVTGTLNGNTESFEITVFGYEYLDDFSQYEKAEDVLTKNSNTTTRLLDVCSDGKVEQKNVFNIYVNGKNGTQSATYDLSSLANVTSGKNVKIMYKMRTAQNGNAATNFILNGLNGSAKAEIAKYEQNKDGGLLNGEVPFSTIGGAAITHASGAATSVSWVGAKTDITSANRNTSYWLQAECTVNFATGDVTFKVSEIDSGKVYVNATGTTTATKLDSLTIGVGGSVGGIALDDVVVKLLN